MRDVEVNVILSMCKNNMCVLKVANEMHMNRNSIEYHMKQILKKYGLNPKCFTDLIQLQKIANGEVMSNIEEHEDLCQFCGKLITQQGRRRFCSDKCGSRYLYQKAKKSRDRCMSCAYSQKEDGTKRYICNKTGKIVISANGQVNKNAYSCDVPK